VTLTVTTLSDHLGSSAPAVVGHEYRVDAQAVITVYEADEAATCTITITDYTELNSSDIVNLVATDGTNYDFTNGSQSSVNGTWESTTSNNATATNLMNVINTSSGPSGTRFTAAVSAAVVTVTQATKGTDGNTTVTLTDTGTAGMSKTDFVNGAAAEVINASDLGLSTISAATITGNSQPALYTVNILCNDTGSYANSNTTPAQVANSIHLQLLNNAIATAVEITSGTDITDTTIRIRVWGSK
jgi:hypothetical protein